MEIVIGLFSFISAVILAILVVFTTWKLFSKAGSSNFSEIKSGNIAAAILLFTELVAFGLLMSRCLYPVSAIIQQTIMFDKPIGMNLLRGIGYALLNYVLAVFTIWLASLLFQWLTRDCNEIEEINKNSNIAVALSMSGVILVTAVLVQSGLGDLLNALIPIPTSGPISNLNF